MLQTSVPAVVRHVTDDIAPQAREAIATIELLKVHAHCCKCGCAVVAKGGQRNSATLVFGRLACPGCAPNVRSERIREEMTGNPKREFSSGKKRDILKARLMAENPRCSCCGKTVRLDAGENAPDGASLVIDRLSCRGCITTVRATAREEKLQKRKSKFPQSGLFSVREWGEILGCGSVKLHAQMKRLHIPVEKGKVNASTWWAIVERHSRQKGGQR